MRGITHVQTSYWDWFHDKAYFEWRRNDILFIGFQETLGDDFNILKSLLNIPSHIRLPADDVTSHRSPQGFDRTLDDTAQAALRKWYARDLEFIDLCRSLRSRWHRRDFAHETDSNEHLSKGGKSLVQQRSTQLREAA
jgi:hypothetical protein